MDHQYNEYGYPAIFHTSPDCSVLITFPDLEDCTAYSRDLEHAQEFAEEALKLYIESAKECEEVLPRPSSVENLLHYLEPNQQVRMVYASI